METFESKRKLFQIDLPKSWRHEFDNDIYTFQQEESYALQVSVMQHSDGKQFDLIEELKHVQEEHPTAHKTEMSEYGAVHYGLDLINSKMLQYIWISGYKNIKIFITLTIESEQEDQKIDERYIEVVNILDTLRIFPHWS